MKDGQITDKVGEWEKHRGKNPFVCFNSNSLLSQQVDFNEALNLFFKVDLHVKLRAED